MVKNKISNTKSLDFQDYEKIVSTIKDAILTAQYEAAKGVNDIQLMLYFAIGRFVSLNTRKGKWGTDAIGTISRLLKADMPGLRGYSASSLKRMRTFYEEWRELDSFKSPIQMGELTNNAVRSGQINEITILPFNFPKIDLFPATDFRSIGFTHHCNILSLCHSREERLFYISVCAQEHLTPDGIKNCIKQNLFAQKGYLPNNFLQKMPTVPMWNT